MAIEFGPMTAAIGASVTGVSLAELDDGEAEQLRDGLATYGVLLFRDQPMTHEQHLAMGRRFGPLHVHPATRERDDVARELLRIHADGTTKHTAGFKWHSDVSCDVEPPMASILTLHTVPSTGGDTLFANTQAAYDDLSEPIQEFLATLSAVHSGAQVYTGRFGLAPPEGKTFPLTEHPVVRTHSETGRKGLFVNENFTSHIVGLRPSESDALLAMLYAHIASPYYQCRFTWEEHSVAFWDNRSVQHLAIWDYFPQTRSGWRVTISGDKPI